MTVWKTKNIYVDIETGEILNKEIAIEKYKIIKKTKTISHANKAYSGTIIWTNECRKQKYIQQRIGFT